MRLRRLPLAVVVFAGLMLPAAAARADGTVTAEYSGTLTGTFVYNPANPAVEDDTRTLKWDEKTTYAVKTSGSGGVSATLVSSTITASGKIDASYASPNQASSCTGTVGLAPGVSASRFGEPSVTFDGTQFVVDGLAPVTSTYIDSTGTGDCSIQPGSSILGPVENAPQTSGDNWLTAHVVVLSNTPEKSFPYKVDYTTPDKRSHLVVNATLTLTNVGGAVPTPENGPFRPADKVLALQNLRHSITAAEGPCLQAGTGLLMFGTGTVLLGVGPAVGPALVIAGSLTASMLVPMCTESIKRVVSDYRRYHDPPFRDFNTAAHPAAINRQVKLASCARAARSVRTFCAGLRTRYVMLVRAARQVSADDHALELTVGRETAAHTAGNTAAVALQARTAITLEHTMANDLRAQGKAGAAVKTLLHSKHISLRLTQAQSTKAIGAVVRLVGRDGVTSTELAAAAPKSLKSRPIDVLAGLADPG